MNYFANAISSFVSDSLPFGTTHFKLAIGMGIAVTLEKSVTYLQNSKFLEKCKRKKNKLVIFNKDNKDVPNPIFTQLQKYIIDKHKDTIKECDLDTSEGKLSYALRNSTLNNIEDVYLGHKIFIYIDKESDTSKGTTNSKATKSILLESKTANIDILKEYIHTHFKLNRNTIKEMTIYNTFKSGNKENKTIGWEPITVKSNRTIENLVISETVKKEVIDDVEWFMDNEMWYAQRGIPYKRGYILYGEPGTGKTSLIKCIANHYKIPVFSIQLDSIDNNDQLVHLMTDINYFIQGHKYYILVFEDVDRSKFFTDKYYEGKLTISCFLNVLDGIAEANGRIMFITGNNITNVTKHEAMVRPGRIDKKVEITKCDNSQIQKLINIFYENDIKLDKDQINIEITPANLIKIMQRCELEEILNYIYNKKDTKNPELKEEIEEIIRKPIKKKRSPIENAQIRLRKMNRIKKSYGRQIKQSRRNIKWYERQMELIPKKEELLQKQVKMIENKKKQIIELKKKDKEKQRKLKLKEKEKERKEKSKSIKIPKVPKDTMDRKEKSKSTKTPKVPQDTIDRINCIADNIRVLRNRTIKIPKKHSNKKRNKISV